MNEHISNGYNGLLYERDRHSGLDFSRVRDIGLRARESVERGYERWLATSPTLIDFVTTPKLTLQSRAAPDDVQSRFPSSRRANASPVVSVVTVCRDAVAVLEATMESVLKQRNIDFEYVIQDGLSTDGTTDVIRRYAHLVASWQSREDAGPYDAMNSALEFCKGDWVLFMNAGDSFVSDDALSRMFSRVRDDADVVYGHHLYRKNGVEELYRAAEFETTWLRLQQGDLSFDWLRGIPCHQATAIRRDLLARLRFDLRYRIAADHDFYFRARKQGARFFNCDEIIAIYAAGGLSFQRYDECRRELAEIARAYGDVRAADQLYTHLDDVTALTARIEELQSQLANVSGAVGFGGWVGRIARKLRS